MSRRSPKAAKKLDVCRDQIKSAKKYRKQELYDELWERLIDLYTGRHYPKGLTMQDRIVVNIAFSTINVIAPSVSVNNPKIVVGAKHPDDDDAAVITEQVVNYWWKHYEIHEEFRLAVDDFLMIGHGWLKTGYRYVEEEVNDPDGYEAELDAAKQDVANFVADNPDMDGEVPTPEEMAANIPTTKMQVVEDRPFGERVSPFDVFVDPEGTSMRDIRWIAQRTIRSLTEVQNDSNYNRAARMDVEPDHRVREEIRPDKAGLRDPEWKRCTIWEYYDLHNGTMCVFSDAGDGFLVDPTPQPYKFGHPFTMLRNYDVPDRFYPMGELEAIEPLQHELNDVRTSQMNDRKQKRRAWLYNPQGFDSKGRTELMSDRDNRMIPVVGNMPLNEAVIPLPGQVLDPQLYAYSEQVVHDINEITGLSEYARGSMPDIRHTATEASIIQDAANSRAADKLAKIEKVIGVVARRLIQLAEQYMTEEQVVRVVGMNGARMWLHFDASDIAGEFDFDVEGGSTQPLNESGRRQQATNLLQALGPYLVPGGPLNIPEVLRYVMVNGMGIKDASRFLANDPMKLPAPQEQPGVEQNPMAEQGPPGMAPGGPPMPPGPPTAPTGPGAQPAGPPPELLAALAGQQGT